MPQERDNQYPHVTAEQWEDIKRNTPREVVAARALIARNITGVPKRPYLVGDNDHAPILRGLVEFTTEVYKLVDAIDAANPGLTGDPADRIIDANAEIVSMMEDPKL